MKKILMISNTTWSLYNFRYGLIEELLKNKYIVEILAPYDESVEKLKKMGCIHYDIFLDRKTKNPFKDIKLFFEYQKNIKKIKPDIILSYTIKPNIYGSIAARKLKIPIINNITGLGNIFNKENLTTKIVKILYKYAFKRVNKVFFQNYDDMNLFLKNNLVNKNNVDRIPGSGVNIKKFIPMLKEKKDNKIKFILIARMLWDKGIGEYVEAAKKLKSKHNNLEFQLLGKLDYENPMAISKEQIEKWEKEGIIDYLGISQDVRNEIKEVDCVVLPSAYREGVPRTLIESAAMQKPIITTDNVGCRDIVEDGYNGFLCKVKDSNDLADKMEKFINLTEEERIKLGKNGRKKVIEEFDEKIVIEKYIEEINKILK
jgi:glycosyltransferase involved in cell wall biosynthesis